MIFDCPHCDSRCEADDSFLNEVIHCPDCDRPIKIERQHESGKLSITTEIPSNWQETTSSGDVLDKAVIPEGRTILDFFEERSIAGGVQVESGPGGARALASRYTLGPLVGEGGMGKVLEVDDNNVRRRVAMKILHKHAQDNDEDVVRFVEEAQITGQLDHPAIVPLYELGVDRHGQVYYTMKYLSDLTLKDILLKIRSGDRDAIKDFPLSRLLDIFQRVCEGIMFAHSKHVIHRDLKPANILVGDFGEVLILDWGLAKILNTRGGGTRQATRKPEEKIASTRRDLAENDDGMVTMDGEVMGTPRYMSPEQADGRVDETNVSSDIFSLGAILYEILTLNPPVGGGNAEEVLDKVAEGFIVPFDVFSPEHSESQRTRDEKKYGIEVAPLEHCPGERVPPALQAVAMKAMAYEQVGRYSSVRRLSREISAYQSGRTTSAEQASFFTEARLLIQRNKPLAISIACAFGLLLLAIGLLAGERGRLAGALDDARKQKSRTSSISAELEQTEHNNRNLHIQLSNALADKAALLIKDGNFPLALSNAKKACEANSDNYYGWYAQGRASLALIKLKDAHDAFSTAAHLGTDANKVKRNCTELANAVEPYLLKVNAAGSLSRTDGLNLSNQIRNLGHPTLAAAVRNATR